MYFQTVSLYLDGTLIALFSRKTKKGVAMFNALKYNEVLEKSGWSKQQATGLLEVVSDMADQNFATKKDLEIISTQIRSEFKTEIQRLDNKIDSVADKIVIRLGTLIVGVATIMSLVNQNH